MDRQVARQGRRIAGRYRKQRRHIDHLVREAERGSPDVAAQRARIRAATRTGRAAAKSRQEAQKRLTDALRQLIRDGLSIREAADRVGLPYHDARQLIRAAEVADGAATAPND